jgi:hypothetical protein
LDDHLTDSSLASILFASANLGGGCSAGVYHQIVKNMQKKIISIHKPPASIRFGPIKHAHAVTVEPFKFSPAEPVAYELSYYSADWIKNTNHRTLSIANNFFIL